MRSSSKIKFARVDHDRARRRGFPEVIYCAGKTSKQVIAIGREILSRSDLLLATRASPELARLFLKSFPKAKYHSDARILVVERKPVKKCKGPIAVVAAGTSDMPVAEEAAITAQTMGNHVKRFYDVGIAGLHRIMKVRDEIGQCSVVIVVAGMEGALPGVVSGLIDKPVIAVPTSVGYGTGLGGIAALLSMLNSCSSGITVVNIDNGFGAAFAATLINKQIG
jgi:NCAIR mutase (PurE)-related protein